MGSDLRHRKERGYTLAINLALRDSHTDCAFVDLVAYKHHMRWMKPCGDTSPSDMREWKVWCEDNICVFDIDGRPIN